MNMKKIRKIAITWLLLVSLIFPMISSIDFPEINWPLFAAKFEDSDKAYHFYAGEVAVITPELIKKISEDKENGYADFAKNPTFVIHNGVFSVTVIGDIEVSIVFGTKNDQGGYDGVTIDRTKDQNSTNIVGDQSSGGWTTIAALSEAAKTLQGLGDGLAWSKGQESVNNNNRNVDYVPTAPFLITGGAKVTALFLGNTEFRAYVNRRFVYNNQFYSIKPSGSNLFCGYAGIQVDGDASLTITNVMGENAKLKVYGSYQFTTSESLDEILKQNTEWVDGIYNVPDGANNNNGTNGGAAIGGGPTYNLKNSGNPTKENPYGTPGEIIINDGTIFAVGGSHAAAIGGGFNGGATTSKIEINGGDITAIGGRFATAIGDGDSLPRNNSFVPSPYFGAQTLEELVETKVIINGGTLKLYGGAGAAAIGTTDEVSHSNGFTTNGYSGMTITITAGNIEAQSGAATSANCAAIGSGNNTNMKDNSITIYSAAVVFARSYSNYAISNKGTESSNANANIPMVNIDPNGFMYLARFNQVSFERDLTLYPIYKDTEGNPVLVQRDAHVTLDLGATPPSSSTDTKYYARKTITQDEIYLYEVKWENGQFVPADVNNGQIQYVKFENDVKLSYYFDYAHPVYTFKVPKTYKAIALTMGSGDYIFHIPRAASSNANSLDNKSENDVYAHFNKTLSGTTSVKISDSVYKNDEYCIHLTYKNQNTFTPTPHVTMDATADFFVDMELFYEDPRLPHEDPVVIDKLENIYKDTVLGYTVYLPNGTTSFGLTLYYPQGSVSSGNGDGLQTLAVQFPGLTATDPKDDPNNKKEITYTGNALKKEYEYPENHQGEKPDLYYQTVNFTVPLSGTTAEGEQVFNIWINKTDKKAGAQAYITYRITVIIKAEYYINVDSLSKEYDGTPVNPNIVSIQQGVDDMVYYDWEYNKDASGNNVVYGNHVSHSGTNGTKLKMVFNANYNGEQIPVTIEYAAVPNETETSISIITRFTYEIDGVEVQKRSTVNINMDGSLVFTLDASSNSVLMTSTTGNYLLQTEKNDVWVKVGKNKTLEVHSDHTNNNDGCVQGKSWTVKIVYRDGVESKEYSILQFVAAEPVEESANINLPPLTNDGETLYSKFDENFDKTNPGNDPNNALAAAYKDACDALNPKNANANLYEIRYSDSYYHAAEKTQKETFCLDIMHVADPGVFTFYKTDDGSEVNSSAVGDYSFYIEDEYLYMYYMFNFYAYKEATGKTYTFTQEQLDQITYRYYCDVNGDGLINMLDEGDLDYYIGGKDAAPKDAGDYLLVMEYKGEQYEAYTAIAFEIRKRTIEITGVENWLTYLSSQIIQYLQNSSQPNHLKTYPLMQPDEAWDKTYKEQFVAEIEKFKDGGWKDMFGQVYYSNLVSGDVLDLSNHVYAYYNEITISYNASKITLRYDAVYGEESVTDENSGKTIISGYQVNWLGDKANDIVPAEDGEGYLKYDDIKKKYIYSSGGTHKYANDNRNYELTGVTNFTSRDTQESLDFSYVHVAGMLAYESEGVIFRKGAAGDENIWRKYWPTTSEEYLKWDESEAEDTKDQLGNYIKPDILESGIDFQSPSNASHQKHVYLKTQNSERNSKYAFDVEYGSMAFVYAKSVWNVNEYKYEESTESYWATNDGTTNKITVINRSDAEIEYSASVSVNSVVAYGVSIGYSNRPSVNKNELNSLKQTYLGIVESAASGDNQTTKSATFYLIVDGEPPKSDSKTIVGTISIVVGPRKQTDNNTQG